MGTTLMLGCLPRRWLLQNCSIASPVTPLLAVVYADVGLVEVHWLDEQDTYFNPIGAKGIGEIGIVGTAAAIANAVYHATGKRVRDLPITLDKLL